MIGRREGTGSLDWSDSVGLSKTTQTYWVGWNFLVASLLKSTYTVLREISLFQKVMLPVDEDEDELAYFVN